MVMNRIVNLLMATGLKFIMGHGMGFIVAAGVAVAAGARFIMVAGAVMVAAVVGVPFESQACTGISFMAKNGSYVMARTMEWGGPYIPYGYAVIPRGQEIVSLTPSGENGLRFRAKYGAVGIGPQQKEFIIEGINETGLSAGLFYFPGAGKYVEYDQALNSETLCDMQFVSWVLSQFSSIEQVKEALHTVRVVSAGIEGNTSTVHWRIGDKHGNQVVLEFIDGQAVFYDNQLGVLTNSPRFDWHLANLNNYINLYGGGAKQVSWGGHILAPFGSGSGSLGLPGDITPTGRFVRAAYYSVTAPQQPNALKTVLQCFHILNNFDIPIGAEHSVGEAAGFTGEARGEQVGVADNSGGSSAVPDVPSATPCTTVTDLMGGKLYYRTNYNCTIRCINLADIDFAHAKYEFYPLDDKLEEPIVDVIIK